MAFENWTTETIDRILPEEFFRLIERNRNHIEKTFPVTVAACETMEKAYGFLIEAVDRQEKKDGYYFYLRNTETNDLIGYVCIKNINKNIQKCELAYFIDQNFEGKGIISKAISQTIDFCFETLLMNKIFICTSKVNFGSQKIATKHKFQQEGILRSEFKNHEGTLEDIMYFGLLKSDWHER